MGHIIVELGGHGRLGIPRLMNPGGGGSTTGSCSASSVAVTFDEVVTTTYGETVKM